MALTYNKDIRDLSIKGTITTNTGVQIHLTPNEIINYSFESQIGSEGLPLGSAESSSFNLEFSNSEHAYTPSMFDNAEVHMFVGIHDGSDYVYSDFGVWYVDASTAPEQSVSISLSGYDALATRFEDYFEDSKGAYPTTIGRIATDVCLASGIRLKTADFPNAGVVVSKMPTWDEEVTLRDVLSYCAICAGGYVRIARNGQVEIVGFMDGQTHELDPDSYHTFTLTGGTAFKFNAIEAMLSEDAEEYTRYAINSNIASNATNTIQIEYNPLLTDAILQSITTELSGIEIESGMITWGGDPSVECTDYYEVTMLDGTNHKIMITSQSFIFDGGLSVTESCDLPAKNAVGSPTYSTSTNMYDAKGRPKASRIPGLDKQVISATIGHFDQLTADTAEFDELLAAYINAINLIANKIDASAIKAGTITADKISSDALDTVSLEAITAKIESLTADDIDADRLAAALAAFTVVTAGTAAFDRTTVQHLIASALNVKDAVGENVFIENLSIRDAQIVGATVGTLCIKASDGRYYNIDVDPKTGSIISTDVTETIKETDVEAGITPDGKRVIVETSITADELNAVNLKAVHALINSIDAARIDADEFFAREGVIELLRTTKIVGDKSITMIAQRANRSFRQEDMPTEDVEPGDTWRIPSTGETYQAEDASKYGLTFYLGSDGGLYYDLAIDDGSVLLEMDGYDLAVEGLVLRSDENGDILSPIRWVLVQDSGMMSKDEFQHYVRIEADGLHVGAEGTTGEVRIDHDSVDVLLGGDNFSSFGPNYVAFGNYQIRRTADGGIAFKMR